MLHYYKFRQELADPVPGREVYVKRAAGRGWPEECPPIRSANAFGFDLLANFDVTFEQVRPGAWRVRRDVVLDSDFLYAASDESDGAPLTQQYAWFWEKKQILPHPISDNVYRQISNQVKISTFLFLKTDPNELLLMTHAPGVDRPWRAMTALVETDWYPASYPWHVVVELDRSAPRITIRKGEPLCRIIPLRRDAYFARAMAPAAFDDFFARGQKWLAAHGRFEHEAPDDGAGSSASERGRGRGSGRGRAARGAGVADITRTYGKQQVRSKFMVLP
jgi:hypothetical protein